MSATIAPAVMPVVDRERGHRWRVYTGYFICFAIIAAVAIYGFDYYMLDAAHRPLSPKHILLKPSGTIGINLGILGFLLFCGIFLYPIRRRWEWLSRIGNSKHWLDFHVVMGISAPFIILFHSSFKFRGFAGMAFWIMTVVALSGVVGRYVYGQIPRSLNAAEISMAELQSQQTELAERLAEQNILPSTDLRSLLRLPSPERVARMPIVFAIVYMIALDLMRPLRIARLRRHALTLGQKLVTVGGLRRTQRYELEQAIDAAHDQAALSKRILFLGRARKIFELWHVIHRPFSYSFAVLALIHIVVVTMLGYVRW